MTLAVTNAHLMETGHVKAMSKTFTTKLVAGHGKLTSLVVPSSVVKSFDSPGRIALQGTINGFPFRASLIRLKDGRHYVAVNGEMRKGAKAKAGDTVKVSLEPSNTVQCVEVPADIQRALERNSRAQAAFDKLSPTHRRAYIGFVSQFPQPAARKRRIEQMIEKLLDAKGPKS